MENNDLAKRIRAFRKLKGMTQQELSDRLGVSIAVLGAIERGTRRPDRRMLRSVAEVLDIDMRELAPSSGEEE
jgi:transcriptional regulator with XRE-family HTH domain